MTAIYASVIRFNVMTKKPPGKSLFLADSGKTSVAHLHQVFTPMSSDNSILLYAVNVWVMPSPISALKLTSESPLALRVVSAYRNCMRVIQVAACDFSIYHLSRQQQGNIPEYYRQTEHLMQPMNGT